MDQGQVSIVQAIWWWGLVVVVVEGGGWCSTCLEEKEEEKKDRLDTFKGKKIINNVTGFKPSACSL